MRGVWFLGCPTLTPLINEGVLSLLGFRDGIGNPSRHEKRLSCGIGDARRNLREISLPPNPPNHNFPGDCVAEQCQFLELWEVV